VSSAIADVFVRAYQSLDEEQRREVIAALLSQEEARAHLQDLEILEVRRQEESRPLREFLDELEHQPRPPGCVRLTDREEYRVRVGEHRILYLINDAGQEVEIGSPDYARGA